MKRPIKTIMIGAVAMLLAATSCQKEETPAAQTGETISISIQGAIGDFTPADGVKATTESVIRVMWEAGDKVYVYDGASNLGELTVSITDPKTSETDARYAYLTGTLTAPQSGTTLLTLVYVRGAAEAPAISNGKISLDISAQSGNDFPFMLYATLPFETSMTKITNKFVPFQFATSVMKVNCANLVNQSGNITFASINEMNTVCVLTLNKAAAPTVSGTTAGTIVRTGEFPTGNGKGTVMVAAAPTAAVSSSKTRYVNIRHGDESYIGMQLTNAELKAGSYYNTICFVKSKKPADQDCVLYCHGIWWAKENLAITESGRREFNGTGHVNGDYFQWAAYPGYCGNATDADKGLLVYNSFKSKKCGDGSSAFTFKSGKKFTTANAPYYSDSEYQKYTSGSVNLEKSDDVANIILGGNWRMPTAEEFNALKEAVYWAWDNTDCGYYVFMPGQGTSGSAGGRGSIADSDDKTKAALFFPAAGYGVTSGFYNVGSDGYYWSSSLSSSDAGRAFSLTFSGSGVSPQNSSSRYLGFTVRPVSD